MDQKYRQLRLGLAGIGLSAYWTQFPDLKSRLLANLAEVEARIASPQRVISNLGLVDTPQTSLHGGHECRRQDIDLLVVYVTTYALSSTVLPLLQRARVPILLLNLQPAAALDYAAFNRMTDRTSMTGEWLAWCSACPVPEIANVCMRLNLPLHQVTGMLHDDPDGWAAIEQWLCAAEVAHTLAHSRLGLMGHYYGGMLDIATDLTQVSGRFGLHIEHLEVDQLSALRRAVEPREIAARLRSFQEFFAIQPDCSAAELERAATTAVALDRLVEQADLDLLAYFAAGTGVAENENVMSSVILGNSMLTARGIPVAGEYEVKNVIAMKILHLLGAGGSFTEYYALDFTANHVLMGHDGPGHAAIAQDRIKVRPLGVYHGKVGSGLSVEMSVRHGPVTLLSVVESSRTGFLLLAAHGHSVPGPILEIGNTNSRYQFPLGARDFAQAWNAHGPAHHCAVGLGHQGPTLAKLAALLNLEYAQVC